MSGPTLPRYIDPARLKDALRRRGGAKAALHALRRLGGVRQKALVGPDYLRINPMGAVCNHACPMCWLQHTPPEELERFKREDRELGMKLPDYERLFAGMPPGLEEVNIVGGGEPLVHPQIVEIMQSIKRHRWRGSLITNGTLLKEKTARAMVEMGWNYTRISVHAGDRETFQAVQGVDRFETLVGNLKTFDRLRREAGRREQCRLCVLHVLQPANITAIKQMFDFSADVGADEIIFEKVIALDDSMRLAPEQYRAASQALRAGAAACPVPCNLSEALTQLDLCAASEETGKAFRPAARCSVGFDQALVNSMGEVYPCCFSDEKLGDLRQQSFREIWFGEKYSEFRRRLNQGCFAGYCISNRCAIKAVLHD